MSQDDTPFEPAPPASRLFFWLALLIVSIMAIFYSFTLLAGLMAELVGGQSVVFGASTGSVAAGVLVTLEVFTGLFLLECMGATAMFPVLHALEAKVRGLFLFFFMFLLFNLASIQAGLVWMARVLAEQAGAPMNQTPPGMEMAAAFVLPFVLILAGLSLDRVARTLRGQPV